jgi:hypothetical protein
MASRFQTVPIKYLNQSVSSLHQQQKQLNWQN